MERGESKNFTIFICKIRFVYDINVTSDLLLLNYYNSPFLHK